MIHTDRMLRAKQQLLEKFRKMTPRIDPFRKRLPPGQHLVQTFPVLDIGVRPTFDPAKYRFRVEGDVEAPLDLSWAEFQQLPRAKRVTDFHCVTTWSKYDVNWGGVAFRTLLERVRPRPGARFVMQTCADGYTTNLPLKEMLGEDILLVDTLDGQPLPAEHGGPLRMLVPHLYAWKSAKFLTTLRFQAKDEAGYWEERGYHMRGDPWREERFG